MKVLISNMTGHTVYLDLDGNSKTEDTVVIGPKAQRISAEIPSEKRFKDISTQYAGKLTLRKARG